MANLINNFQKNYLTYQSGAILDEKDENGRYKTIIDLITYDLDKISEKLTLHLLSVTRYHEVKNKWKVHYIH